MRCFTAQPGTVPAGFRHFGLGIIKAYYFTLQYMVLTIYDKMPVPDSRFVKIKCQSCSSASIVFTMAKSTVNCKFCGNLLAKPTGGKAALFGKIDSMLDELPEISIISDQQSLKTIGLLLDTVIIHHLINGKPIHEFVKDIYDPIRLVVLDRILIETQHMEKHKYDISVTTQQIIDRLETIGTVDKIQLDHAKEPVINARELYESKKYVDSFGKELSETDCILLCMSLALDDVKLVTQDKMLIFALQKEAQAQTD